MSIIMQFVDRVHEVLDNNADARTTNWFLMSSPFPTMFMCLGYVYLVKVLGPKFMENRKPFQLKKVLIAYNLFQVMFSAWLFYEIGMSGWLTGDYSLKCQPVDRSTRPLAVRMAHASWWYYFSKFTEFFDTIFFVLRKKNDHVSTLHVIHHGCMPLSVWFGVKMTPGGHSTFFGLLNTFVHIVMYAYYLLSALGPAIQPYLWWKRYLTALQMVQFIAIMVHAFQLLFVDCNYPKAFVWIIGLHACLFFFLFRDFYKQSYAQKQKTRAAAAAAKMTNGSVGNGKENGIANGDGVHSRRRDAADYYVKGDSVAPNELNLRKPYTATQ